jgi:hypothetical protein
LILAYRGYGHSEGKPSENGLKLDADAALIYLLTEREDVDNERIFVFGRSLGGAIATQLAISKPESVKGIIVENTFTSLSDMVDALLPFLTPFKFLIQRIFYPTVDRIGKVKCPILFIRGLKDEIVPCEQSLVLYDKAKNARFKEMWECADGDHNNTWKIGGNNYLKSIRSFLHRCEHDIKD